MCCGRVLFQICRYLMQFRSMNVLKLSGNFIATRRIISKAFGKHIRIEELYIVMHEFGNTQRWFSLEKNGEPGLFRDFALQLSQRYSLNRWDMAADLITCKISHLRAFQSLASLRFLFQENSSSMLPRVLLVSGCTRGNPSASLPPGPVFLELNIRTGSRCPTKLCETGKPMKRIFTEAIIVLWRRCLRCER